jgi:hypothetical protein
VPVQKSVRLFEHAQWLDAASLEGYLSGSWIPACVKFVDLYGKASREQVRLLLQLPQPARYVAVVREDLRFERLLDRQPLLEEVARDAVLEGCEPEPVTTSPFLTHASFLVSL